MFSRLPRAGRYDRRVQWHAASVGAVLDELNTTPDGLSATEAATRLARVGPNRLAQTARTSVISLLLHQLSSVVVILLLAAAVIAVLMGDRVEAAAIGAVLVTNTLIGFITEMRARRAMEALLTLDVARAVVIRAGTRANVDAALLVPGDVVALEAGAHVPADGRVIDESELRLVIWAAPDPHAGA